MDNTLSTLDLIELVKEEFSDLISSDELNELVNRLEGTHRDLKARFKASVESDGGVFHGSVQEGHHVFQGLVPDLTKPESKHYEGTLHDLSFGGHKLSLFRDTDIFDFKAGRHLVIGFWSKDTGSGRKPLGIFVSNQKLSEDEFEPHKGTEKGHWR